MAGDLQVTFHGTQLDAQSRVLPVINPYPNDDPITIVYGPGLRVLWVVTRLLRSF